ncbi:MAG: hypothetical protein R2911_35215 [Caldilineaceae bacterium]
MSQLIYLAEFMQADREREVRDLLLERAVRQAQADRSVAMAQLIRQFGRTLAGLVNMIGKSAGRLLNADRIAPRKGTLPNMK